MAGCIESTESAPEPEAPASAPNAELVDLLADVRSFPELRIETDFGTIRMVLFTEWTPQTATHIGDLADSGFYDGLIFHRVVDDFVIQGGDPTGTGEGGSGPGGASTNMVPLEIHEGLEFGVGAVGLARWTDDTGDSQFFITEEPAPHLHDPQGATGDAFGAYAMFGQVFEGVDVVRQIAAVDVVPGADRPVEDVVMRQVALLPPPTDLDAIGLVRTIWYPAFADALDAPRHMVAGHPFTWRILYETECPKQVVLRIAPLNSTASAEHVLDPTIDSCTFDVTMALPQGAYEADVAGDVMVFHVAPWHDAYA